VKPHKPRGVPWAHSWGGKPNYLEPAKPNYAETKAYQKEYHASRYARLVAERKCVRCKEPLQEYDTHRNCELCREAHRVSRATEKGHKNKSLMAVQRHATAAIKELEKGRESAIALGGGEPLDALIAAVRRFGFGLFD
jgi:hypothetical protein